MDIQKLMVLLGMWLMTLGAVAAICAASGYFTWIVALSGFLALALLGCVGVLAVSTKNRKEESSDEGSQAVESS